MPFLRTLLDLVNGKEIISAFYFVDLFPSFRKTNIFSIFKELLNDGWLGLVMLETDEFESYFHTFGHLNINKSESFLAKILNLR